MHSRAVVTTQIGSDILQVGRNIPLTIAANKQDLLNPRTEGGVPDERSRAFAESVGAAYFRTSARTGVGIEQACFDDPPHSI